MHPRSVLNVKTDGIIVMNHITCNFTTFFFTL